MHKKFEQKIVFHKEKINELCRRNGVVPIIDSFKEPVAPDNPPCDCCGKLWTGIHACAVCQSAFYCSKECQRTAWKQGHKKECKHLQAKAKTTAERVVNTMMDTKLSSLERVQGLERLSCTGFYKAALECGINSAIQKLMKEEKKYFLVRFLEDTSHVSFVCWIVGALFRDGRREGHGLDDNDENKIIAFRDIDGYRCKSYIMSSPDAFEDWFQASIEIITSSMHRDVAGIEDLRANAIRYAIESLNEWHLIFANKKVSKAIILGRSKCSDQVAVQRVKWIAKQIKCALIKFWNAAEGIDIEGQLEFFLYTLSAEIMLRVKEHKVPVDFFKLLGLKGRSKRQFNQSSLPLADHMIRKGTTLEQDEGEFVLRGGRIDF